MSRYRTIMASESLLTASKNISRHLKAFSWPGLLVSGHGLALFRQLQSLSRPGLAFTWTSEAISRPSQAHSGPSGFSQAMTASQVFSRPSQALTITKLTFLFLKLFPIVLFCAHFFSSFWIWIQNYNL
jgi:hypothetical protein